jgi:hypothetical protein
MLLSHMLEKSRKINSVLWTPLLLRRFNELRYQVSPVITLVLAFFIEGTYSSNFKISV